MNNYSRTSIFNKLNSYRDIGDKSADAVLKKTDAQTLYALFNKDFLNHDFLASSKGTILEKLTVEIKRDLESFDNDRLIAGQRVFQKYAMEIMTLLGLYALPYCYAAAEGAKVLVMSKYILENPSKRLQETGEFILETNRIGAFDDSMRGLMATVKVRMMHATVRQFASKKIKHETPINQEDLLGTNLAFSIIIIRGLKKVGIELNKREAENYLYLWYCIGVILGIKRDLLPENIKEASILESIIRERQFRESDEGKALTSSLIALFKTNWTFSPIRPESIVAELVGMPCSQYIGLNSSLESIPAISLMKLKHLSKKFSESNFDVLLKQMDRMKMEL